MNYNSNTQEELIIKYLPLVERIAGRIEINNREYEEGDLINIGVIGLMDALKRFDPSKSVPFEAYASLRIRGSIMDELRRTGRVSRERIAKLNQYYAAKEKLENQLLRSPDESEIQKELGIDAKDLSKLHETVHYLSNTSLDSVIFSDKDSEVELIDLIEDEDSASPEEEILEKETREYLKMAIDGLDDREKLILDLYYVQDLTLKEIGYILDVSIPRVSQLHGKALIKLRKTMSPIMEA